MAIVCALLAASALATRPNTHPRCPQGVSVSTSFIEGVWNKSRWRRGAPKATTITAWHRNVKCFGKKSRKLWRHARREFYEHRKEMLWLEKYNPYVYPDGSRWAVPYPIAWCESGGNYYVGPYGAYGLILEPTWLPPKVQDEIAYRYINEVGVYQAWVRWESGCMYR